MGQDTTWHDEVRRRKKKANEEANLKEAEAKRLKSEQDRESLSIEDLWQLIKKANEDLPADVRFPTIKVAPENLKLTHIESINAIGVPGQVYLAFIEKDFFGSARLISGKIEKSSSEIYSGHYRNNDGYSCVISCFNEKGYQIQIFEDPGYDYDLGTKRWPKQYLFLIKDVDLILKNMALDKPIYTGLTTEIENEYTLKKERYLKKIAYKKFFSFLWVSILFGVPSVLFSCVLGWIGAFLFNWKNADLFLASICFIIAIIAAAIIVYKFEKF